MRPLPLTLSLLSFGSMIILAIALLGGKIDPVPAATIGTALFVALMRTSGSIETDL